MIAYPAGRGNRKKARPRAAQGESDLRQAIDVIPLVGMPGPWVQLDNVYETGGANLSPLAYSGNPYAGDDALEPGPRLGQSEPEHPAQR